MWGISVPEDTEGNAPKELVPRAGFAPLLWVEKAELTLGL